MTLLLTGNTAMVGEGIIEDGQTRFRGKGL